ncbi:sensor histidine kinase [Hippea jasoniae]|uniref:sensor histidine kinase n=1 Tax=Hippea jasoniae TaxID=944479 RepID=UPI0005541B8A|nr:HAMP domain-containing sensor histidine kinase [Hippea jasoniae]
MKNDFGLERFAKLVIKQDDLRTLYFRAFAFLLDFFDADKLYFFKFSKRKQCFDPKAALNRDILEEVVKGDYESFNIEEAFEKEFNLNFRAFGSSCNDVVRSLAKLVVDKKVKSIKSSSIKSARLKSLWSQLKLNDEAFYVPLFSLNEMVGFVLFDKVIDYDNSKAYFDLLGCAIGRLFLLKNIDNLSNLLATKDDEDKRKQKLYQIGKTAMIMAHEMKNSLIGIMGLFSRLKAYVDEDKKAQRYYEIIESQLKKLYEFTFDINKFSKIGDGADIREVEIADIIDNSIEMASSFSNDVKFSVSIGKDASVIEADKSQLEQVFLNLFKNSIEAKKQGSVKIDVSVRKEGEFVVIKIKDNSGGVDEETLKNMMKPFFTTKSYGTGLGLAIVKGIIDIYNGSLSFKNVKDGLECVIKLPQKNNTGGSDGRKEKNHGCG